MFIDVYIEEINPGYRVYGVKRGGEIVLLGRHFPWF